MLGDKRFLRTIRLRNLLSFGPESGELELNSLNVLIGPNGAGKSNLIDAISLLQAAPRNLQEPIQAGGGISEWLWKGSERPPIAETKVKVHYPPGEKDFGHVLQLSVIDQRAALVDEAVFGDGTFYFSYESGKPVIAVKPDNPEAPEYREIHLRDLAADQSIVSQRKDPDQYPEITFLGAEYTKIRLFREWDLGRNSPARRPQPTDLTSNFLDEDASNIALVLNDLEHRSGLRREMVEKLQDADPAIEDFSTRVLGGTIQLFLHYSGLRSPVPATRLSDGTFRYLCLLAVLCHPEPPPLVCLEEPELGLHPDLLPRLAELLVDASHRMQLIVTTHSDTLVDGLTKTPEAVVVCEKEHGATKMTRYASADLAHWLSQYGMGQLWRSGEIGGNRW